MVEPPALLGEHHKKKSSMWISRLQVCLVISMVENMTDRDF